MKTTLPQFVLGYHGCDQSLVKQLLSAETQLKFSKNAYDWLGHGIYFWEQNYQRALEWAQKRYREESAVIGAVIDLGYCLNLTDSASTNMLFSAYQLLVTRCKAYGIPLPENRPSKLTQDVLLRDLDCAVIQQLHDFNVKTKRHSYDSVRGIFLEGKPPYPGSEFREKTHVQICICNPNCIKGYFKPIPKDVNFPIP